MIDDLAPAGNPVTRDVETGARGMRRGDMLKFLAGSSFALLAACNDGAPTIKAQAGASGSAHVSTAFGSQVYETDDVTRSAAMLAGMGAKYMRVSVQVPLDFLDATVGAATAHGLRVILLSAYASQPIDIAAYARAAAILQVRYAAANPVWEIWNEPNLAASWNGPPDVLVYIRVLAATATALRAAGAVDIWTGGTSGVDVNWIYNLSARGAFRSANGCAVHSYRPPGFARTEYIQTLGLLPAGVGLHTTETCIASSVGDQSSFFNEMWYLHRELNLPTMIWCEFRDGTAGPSGASNEPYGLVAPDYTTKAVYGAAELAIRTDD